MCNYKIELEIFEGKGGPRRAGGDTPDLVKEGICAWMYGRFEPGQRFRYPEDLGSICPWLRDSLAGMIRVLEAGGILPWQYKGTKYEKVIDPEGITTEFVRCPDPTGSGIVMKVTRNAVPG